MQLTLAAEPLHLNPGDDVRTSLEGLARQRQGHGFVLSVVGNLSQAAFQCPGRHGPTVLGGELEIITLTGTLAPEGVHLHLSFSDGNCQVWGGHLEAGSVVLRGADLLVGWLASTGSAVPTAASMEPRVQIASHPSCPYSARALRLLRTLGIDHEQVAAPAGSPVPQIWIDGDLVGGYDALAELHGQGALEHLRRP
ncbi:MAG: hypothetical protein RLZZ468_302 [Cyanobacteriota bacterium]|jgi:predicted DNA-binding protein with PD1-like motif/glutaredoxin